MMRTSVPNPNVRLAAGRVLLAIGSGALLACFGSARASRTPGIASRNPYPSRVCQRIRGRQGRGRTQARLDVPGCADAEAHGLRRPGADRHERGGQAKKRLGDKLLAAAELAAAARPPQQFLERLVVKDGTRVTLIPVTKLDYVEAQDDYIALASGGKKHLKQQTIASVEAGLDPARFVRIHRSYIVNFERVARIEPYGKDSRLAILADGTRLPVSRTGYARLKALLDDRA